MSRRARWTLAIVAVVVVAAVAVWILVVGPVLGEGNGGGSAPPPEPTATAEFDLDAQAQREFDQLVASCTAEVVAAAAAPEGCGIRVLWGTEFAAVDSIRFRVEQAPELELRDDGTFVADDGVLVATVRGTDQDGSAHTETYRTTSWALTGAWAVQSADTDRTVQLRPW